MDDLQALTWLENILSGHRGFGDSEYLQAEMRARHEAWLAELASRMPAAQRLSRALGEADPDASFRALGATVVRCSIQHAYANLTADRVGALSLAECEKIMQSAADHLERGNVGALPLDQEATQANRIGDQPLDGAVWNEPVVPDVLSSGLNTVIWSNYGDLPTRPEPADVDNLRAGVRLLRRLVPRLTDNTLGHAHLVAVVADQGRWRGTGSSSQFRLSGTIFLNRALLEDPWTVAEQILHESLHQKLYDFRFGHTLFRPADPPRLAARVRSPWNPFDARDGNAWDTFRVFAAFHVYVHLAFLSRVAEARSAEIADLPDPVALRQRARAATVRARYLGEQLTSEPCWVELGPGGHRFHQWLTAVLDVLDPEPPPAGSSLHLLLDLYRKEAARVQSSAVQLDPAALREVLAAEVGQARALLQAVGTAPQETALFEPALEPGPDIDPERLGAEFYRVRQQIAEQLHSHSTDGYRLHGQPIGGQDPDAVASGMIETSSRRLSELFAESGPGTHR